MGHKNNQWERKARDSDYDFKFGLSYFCNYKESYYYFYRKIAYDITHLARKKWLIKSCKLCWKAIGQTLIFGVILKTNKKLIGRLHARDQSSSKFAFEKSG